MNLIASDKGNRIAVRQLDIPDKVGGFLVSETHSQKPLKGVVIDFSTDFIVNGVSKIPSVKKGDTVQYEPYSGIPIEINNEEYLILYEPNIILIED